MRGVGVAGGLAGRMIGGIVIAGYANVDVNIRENVAGGLVGAMDAASIVSASYAVGEVEVGDGHDKIGGLTGERNGDAAEIRASYFDREHSGLPSCCGVNAPSPDDAPRKSVELHAPTAAVGIYAGWDRLDVDGVDQGDDGDLHDDAPWDFGGYFDYPVLVFGVADGGTARRRSQREAQPISTLTPTFDGDKAVSEGGTATYVVSLPEVLPAGVSASWSWSVSGRAGISASDFSRSSGHVTVAPGVSSASFSLRVVADGVAELTEFFHVSLSDARFEGAPGKARLGLPAGTVRTRVAANELRRITVAAPETVAEGATATFTVSLGTAAGDDAVVVEYEIDAVSGDLTSADLQSVAIADRGGAASARMLSLPLGGRVTMDADGTATVSVRVAPDDVRGESVERFRMRLTYCANCGGVYPAEIGAPSFAEVGIFEPPLVVSAQVYLEGAYDASSGTMRTRLIDVLPRRQPYDAAPWHYRTTTTVPHVPEVGLGGVEQPIVDWVLVELRAAAPGAGAGVAVPVTNGRAAGLLLADGRIAGINEGAPAATAALSLDGVRMEAGFAPGSEIYVQIHHRNHLSVMSATSATSAGCAGDYCADFRGRQSYVGCPQLRRAGAPYVMAAGDVNRSGVVSWGDDDLILNSLGSRGYASSDLNFDARVSVDDVRAILDNNLLSSACRPRP